ncbi:MAG TPA: MotA/TolQ/ExbB proton channel family protein, partial [Polyangia bacterium]
GAPASPEARVGLIGLNEIARGREAAAEAMASAKSRERLAMERRLGILGTLGNNAPFIGLFGTVLGIIKAFADLSRNAGGGANVVMSGISEALVATAVGLMVAIPAVIAFNVLQGRVRRAMGRIDSMAHLILSAAASEELATARKV